MLSTSSKTCQWEGSFDTLQATAAATAAEAATATAAANAAAAATAKARVKGFDRLTSTRIAVLLCAMIMALCCVMPATAHADVRKADVVVGESVSSRGLSVSQCPSIDAAFAYVVDSDGNVYFERDSEVSTKIASITKVMTAVVAVDSVPLNTTITVSSTAASIGESSAMLQEGDSMPLSEALKALLLPSGNDAAQAIAESVGALMLQSAGQDSSDSKACAQAFVDAMNAKCTELGMTNTVYRNPHGLDDTEYEGDQHSCAKDQGILVSYAMQKEAISSVTGQESATVKVTRSGASASVSVTSTDELIGVYDGACGVKTGYTDYAGACFAGACQRNGKYLFSIVLDSTSEASRFEDTTTLWDWVYNNQVNYKLVNTTKTTTYKKTGETVPLVAQVADATWVDKTIPATVDDPSASIEVFSLSGNISQTVSYKTIEGDVKAGDVVGTITYKQRNNVVATQNLIAAEDVAAPNLFEGIGVWWTKFIGGFTGDDCVADSVLYNESSLINDKTS